MILIIDYYMKDGKNNVNMVDINGKNHEFSIKSLINYLSKQ